MQTLDQGQGLKVKRPDMVVPRIALGRLDRFGNGFHVQRPLRFIVLSSR
jgi:hypothetical protein